MKQLSSKREEAVAVEKELCARTKDVEDVKRALESVSFDEGKMEALQKVVFFFFYWHLSASTQSSTYSESPLYKILSFFRIAWLS